MRCHSFKTVVSLFVLLIEAVCATRWLNSNESRPRPVGNWLSPEYNWIFEFSLPKPVMKSPKFTYTDEKGLANINYYEVEVRSFEQHIYPSLNSTRLVGYDGISPGPMFVMRKGTEAVVRFTNNGPSEMAVHVHGQYNRSPFDGWASDFALPGQYKVDEEIQLQDPYALTNAGLLLSECAKRKNNLDHTEFKTGENAYRGQEGFYIITDPAAESLGLPSGDYDITLALGAKTYNQDGSLLYTTNDNAGLWGDIIQVNGQPWPYLNVEPRKYRFRILNGAVSRTFELSFTALYVGGNDTVSEGGNIPFQAIASDSGLFSHPVETSKIAMSMGERYEIVFDFSNYAGQNITLRNARGVGENVDYAATDLVMRFVVGNSITDNSNNGEVPSTLRYIAPPPEKDDADKEFTFHRVNDRWLINGVGFADVERRILTRPPRGADEIWLLRNGNGNGTHPVHIHLVDFQILSRTGGRDTVLPYESAGMKDIVWLAGGETVRVLARYAPWDGVYMFHCHNLVHEDHDMLAALNVTQLEDWGYDNSTIFIDPLQPEFRPKNITSEDYTEEAIRKKLAWFYSTNAYNHGNVAGVSSALDAYQTGSTSVHIPLETFAPVSNVTTVTI